MIFRKYEQDDWIEPHGYVLSLRRALIQAGCCKSMREAKSLLTQKTEITLWPAPMSSNMTHFNIVDDANYVFIEGDHLQVAKQMPKMLVINFSPVELAEHDYKYLLHYRTRDDIFDLKLPSLENNTNKHSQISIFYTDYVNAYDKINDSQTRTFNKQSRYC